MNKVSTSRRIALTFCVIFFVSAFFGIRGRPAEHLDAPDERTFDKPSGYDSYVSKQSSKLLTKGHEVAAFDLRIEKDILRRYANRAALATVFPEKLVSPTILCVGARLGGEVRAFKKLGVMAIGIDLEPGNRSEHVLVGDAHDIAFPAASFDALYVNVIDHIKYLDTFAREVKRVLKSGGRLVVDMDRFPPDEWAVHDLRTFWRLDALGKVTCAAEFLSVFEKEKCEVLSTQRVRQTGNGDIAHVIFRC